MIPAPDPVSRPMNPVPPTTSAGLRRYPRFDSDLNGPGRPGEGRQLVVAVLVLITGLVGQGRAGASGALQEGAPPPGLLARAAELAHEPDAEMERLATRALRLLNAARAESGLPTLAPDHGLAVLARRHALELARRQRVTHHSELFDLTTERRVRISYPFLGRFGENVARNGSVERLHQSLLRSPEHRESRMDPEFTHVGIGVVRESAHMLYQVEVFAEARGPRSLEPPGVYYFEASPDAYDSREAPRSELHDETLIIGARGPEDPEYWTNRGIDAFLEGELEMARDRFLRALELKDDYHYARYNLARVLLRMERPEAAARQLDVLLDAWPDDIDARYARGTAALLTADYGRAEKEFRRVLENRREDAGAWYNLGLALEYQDLPDEAARAYLTALDLEPTMMAARRALDRLGRAAAGR